MELSDEPELGVGATVDVVGRDKAEYVLVAEAVGVVYVALVLPGLLVGRVESLDGDVFAAPLALVHLAEAALADARVEELDLAGDRALHALREAGAGARARPFELGRGRGGRLVCLAGGHVAGRVGERERRADFDGIVVGVGR